MTKCPKATSAVLINCYKSTLSANVGASVTWYLHFIVNCTALYKQMTLKNSKSCKLQEGISVFQPPQGRRKTDTQKDRKTDGKTERESAHTHTHAGVRWRVNSAILKK